MFYVALHYVDNNKAILGNMDGQGFYDYKRLSTVVNRIAERANSVAKYRKESVVYKIYSICESEKFKDFEDYKTPIQTLTISYW